LQKMQAS